MSRSDFSREIFSLDFSGSQGIKIEDFLGAKRAKRRKEGKHVRVLNDVYKNILVSLRVMFTCVNNLGLLMWHILISLRRNSKAGLLEKPASFELNK